MIWIRLTLIFLMFGTLLQAQTFSAYEKAGDEALAVQNYYSAYVYYGEALQIDSSKISILYKYADAARLWQSYPEANYYYRKVYKSGQKRNFPLINYNFGIVKKHLMDYDGAIKLFKAYIRQTRTGVIAEKAKNELIACEQAKLIMKDKVDVEITHLDKNINSNYSEFAPAKNGDLLYYSALRYKQKDQNNKETYFSKVLVAAPNEKGRPEKYKLNTNGLHTANVAFSPDGSKMFFTRCENLATGGTRCQIYQRTLGTKRPKDKKLPSSINLENYTATHPTIGYDSISKTLMLYFVSDRTGGKGGLDIWKSQIKTNGTFTKPINCGEQINTIGDEITPFFQNNTQTLFFSSDFHHGLGGFDIFEVKDNKKQKPKNVGFPLNSSYNDIYYVQYDNEGYLASNRPEAMTITKGACCNDIFAFAFPKKTPKIEPPLAETPIDTLPVISTLAPKIVEKPKPIIITSTPQTWEQVKNLLPIKLYFDNDHPDPRTTKTTTSKTYEQTYFAYYNKKNTFVQKYTAPLVAVEKSNATYKVERFFEDEVKSSYERLNGVMDFLFLELQTGRTVQIFVKGYTSPLASSRYNEYLAGRRISSIHNYFNNYKSGVLKPYIASQQLKIINVPLGETTASSVISDDMKDKRNSVYSVEASRERRVEILNIE